MEDILTVREQENKRKGQLAGGIMFILLVALLLIPLFWYQNPPPGQEGIQVNLGIPDIGMGEDLNAPIASAEETVEETTEEVVEPVTQPVEAAPPPPSKPNSAPEVITTDDPAAIALRKKQEKEAADRRAEQDRERREAEAQADADRKAREAAAKAEADRKAREAAAANTRNEIGGLFNSGGGGGTTNTPGDGGARDGDPNSSNIGTKSFGSGTVGGGLGSRGVSNSPRVEENSQKAGVVVVSLCVDADGRVIPSSVQFTQRGSTTTDSQLVNAAIRNAKQWGFSKGSVDRQCGTITYNFKVQ
jgi:membrane protein involved in colicin uptake